MAMSIGNSIVFFRFLYNRSTRFEIRQQTSKDIALIRTVLQLPSKSKQCYSPAVTAKSQYYHSQTLLNVTSIKVSTLVDTEREREKNRKKSTFTVPKNVITNKVLCSFDLVTSMILSSPAHHYILLFLPNRIETKEIWQAKNFPLLLLVVMAV